MSGPGSPAGRRRAIPLRAPGRRRTRSGRWPRSTAARSRRRRGSGAPAGSRRSRGSLPAAARAERGRGSGSLRQRAHAAGSRRSAPLRSPCPRCQDRFRGRPYGHHSPRGFGRLPRFAGAARPAPASGQRPRMPIFVWRMFGKSQQVELLAELERLRRQVSELEGERARGLRLDSVTGMLSAHAFRGRLGEELVRARRYQRPLTLAVLAIDDFTAIETRHGFKAGDELMAALAKRLGQTTRSHDLVGRTGRAEFAILLPDTSAVDAQEGLGRLLIELEALRASLVSGAAASLGLAGLGRGVSAEGLLATARIACEHAERTGGGRAVVASELEGAAQETARGLQRDAIEALAVALTERDRYTGEHSKAVIEMAAAVARYMGLRATEVERIRSAALLHDIGKVAIPDEILH